MASAAAARDSPEAAALLATASSASEAVAASAASAAASASGTMSELWSPPGKNSAEVSPPGLQMPEVSPPGLQVPEAEETVRMAAKEEEAKVKAEADAMARKAAEAEEMARKAAEEAQAKVQAEADERARKAAEATSSAATKASNAAKAPLVLASAETSKPPRQAMASLGPMVAPIGADNTDNTTVDCSASALAESAASAGRSFGKFRCWRCGEYVSADMEHVAAHMRACKPEIRLAPLEDATDPFAIPILSPAAEVKDGASGTTLVSKSQGKNSATLGYKLKKVMTFWDSSKPAEEGIVYIQSAQTGRYLSVVDGEVETRAHGNYGDVTEESQWMIVRTNKEGVVIIRSLLTGWLLRVGDDSDADGVSLARGHRTAFDEWRLLQGCAKEASLQSAETGAFLTVSMARGLGGVATSDGPEGTEPVRWRVVTVGEQAEEDGFQLKIQKRIEELTPELDPVTVYTRMETTVERLILLMLDPVLNGIPKLSIPPVRQAAKEMVGQHGSARGALEQMWREAEANDAEYSLQGRLAFKAAELLMLRYMPFVGCGAYLSTTLWYHLRIAALVAELHGHDVFDPEIQSMILFCIVPGGQTSEPSQGAPGEADQKEDRPPEVGPKSSVAAPVLRASKGLAHALARQVMVRATGWRTAAEVYDLSAAIIAEAQVVPPAEPGECTWRKEGTPPPDGYEGATLWKAELLFKPSIARSLRPAELTLLCIGACMPIMMNVVRHTGRLTRALHAITRVPQLAILLVFLLGLACLVYAFREKVSLLLEEHPEWATGAICTFHAALPLLAAFDGTSLLVKGITQRPLAADGAPQGGAGVLCFMLGSWIWLRLMQRCLAPPGSPSAKGEPSAIQRVLLYTIIGLGLSDLAGPQGLGVHQLPPLGAMESHHWLAGLLQGVALESQLRLLMLLKDREVLLRVLGATRMMGLALVLFVGGLSASVGFLVAHGEFTKFAASIAPPPRLATVVLMLRRERSVCAMLIGAGAGFLFQLPTYRLIMGFSRLFGVFFGGAVLVVYMETFEEHREGLLDPNGARWLLMMPETTQKVREAAMQAWAKLRVDAAELLAQRGTGYVGKALIDTSLNWVVKFWEKPLANSVEVVVDVADAAAHGLGVSGTVRAAAT